uniref:Transposase n=1 Tax=Meloidogyne hapla TaxID=6305 RepID=A0A1I8AXE0_MELHA
MPLHIFKNGEIIGNNEEYKDAKFRCEFKKNPILLEIIPWRENEKIHRKLFSINNDVKYENGQYQISIVENEVFMLKENHIDQINEKINKYQRIYLENNLKEIYLKTRMLELNNKMEEVSLDKKESLKSGIKKEYSEMIQKDQILNNNSEALDRLMTLFNLRTLLELYNPLSQKFGYLNKEYDERIRKILEQIHKCINNHTDCLKLTKKRFKKKTNKLDKFENKWNEIIERLIRGKISVEIIKVSFLESIQYIGVDIKYFEDVEREGKPYKLRMLTDEERMKRAKIIEMFYFSDKYYGIQSEIARELNINQAYVHKLIERFEELGTLENRPKLFKN